MDNPTANQPENDPTALVPLQGKAPAALRAAVKANSADGPEMQVFYAAAIYAALRKPREQDWAMVQEFRKWVADGCPPIGGHPAADRRPKRRRPGEAA